MLTWELTTLMAELRAHVLEAPPIGESQGVRSDMHYRAYEAERIDSAGSMRVGLASARALRALWSKSPKPRPEVP